MSITQLYAGADGDVLNSTGAQVRDSVNALINTHVVNLKALPVGATIQTETVYTVIALSAGTSGGGHFIWSATTNKTAHDGSNIIAPEAIAAWDGTGTNIAQLDGWTGTGTGCWVLIGSMFSPTALSMEGRVNLSQLPETNFYLTNNTGVTDLPTGWAQGRYHLQQIGRPKDSYCTQIITDVGAAGANGGSVARQAIRRMRNVGIWSDWFEILNTNSALYKELTPNVANIATLKLRAGAFDNQRVFVAEYNAGTDVGGGGFIWNSTSTAAANDVTIFEVTGVATGRWIRDWSVLTPEMAGMVGDNSTNNDTAIARLIAFAKVDNTPIHWQRRRYFTGAGNIVDFHLCTHFGTATISRNGTLWHITPQGVQENHVHVSPTGSATNDGMTAATPVTPIRARDILTNIGDKAGNGIWGMRFAAGTYTGTGMRLSNWPSFLNKVRIWGPTVASNATPTAIWDGATSPDDYAFRADSGAVASMNFHFKDIKFTNWNSGGPILLWAEGSLLVENVHVNGASVGVSARKGYIKVIYGKYEGITGEAIGIAYGANGNVGGLNGEGVYIRCDGAGRGIGIGRNTVAYIQGCDIDNTSCHINVTRLSRIRTQANTFGPNFNSACVLSELNSVWTPDNDSGYPDIYPTLSETKPALIQTNGAVHLKIDRLSQRSLHATSDGQIVTITDTLQNQLGALNVTFTPFRLPKWFLYSPTFRLDVEIGANLSAGAGGVLTLNVQGSTGTTQLAAITIPNVASATKGMIKFSVTQRPNVSTAHYSAEFKAAGILSEYNNTANLNISAIRTNTEDDHIYRLYWTSNNTNQVELFNMRTYVES